MLPRVEDPALLVGADTLDDAAVYRLSDDLALVQTVDFFTPVVDDPYDFGRIAAANAFSDVYAMGGRPLTALNIVCFPSGVLPLEYLGRILQGGAETARLAGATIVGGHTIDDPEPKYGLAVTGFMQAGRQNSPTPAAEPGDLLVLTKPLGHRHHRHRHQARHGLAERHRRRHRLHGGAEPGRAPRWRASTACARSPTSPASACWATWARCAGPAAWRPRCGSTGCPPAGAAELAAEGVVPGGTKRNLEYVERGRCSIRRWRRGRG